MEQSAKRCYKCNQELHSGESVCEGLHATCFCEWFCLSSPEEFQDVALRKESTISSDWSHIVSSFFHGKFRKYSAKLGKKSYLLKVQQQEFPELPAIEYLCNQIAKSLHIFVPNHFYIRFQNELDTFVCENFMQYHPGCDLVHIWRLLETPEQFSCEGLLRVLESKIQRYDDIQRFVQLSLFDAFIGNHDRHGRNLALIQSPTEMRLSPFYDNPSYLGIEDELLLGAQLEPRGAIATKDTKEPTMRDYVIEWLRLGLDEPIREMKMKIHLDQVHKLIEKSFVSPKRKLAFIKLTKRRFEEFCDATKSL